VVGEPPLFQHRGAPGGIPLPGRLQEAVGLLQELVGVVGGDIVGQGSAHEALSLMKGPPRLLAPGLQCRLPIAERDPEVLPKTAGDLAHQLGLEGEHVGGGALELSAPELHVARRHVDELGAHPYPTRSLPPDRPGDQRTHPQALRDGIAARGLVPERADPVPRGHGEPVHASQCGDEAFGEAGGEVIEIPVRRIVVEIQRPWSTKWSSP